MRELSVINMYLNMDEKIIIKRNFFGNIIEICKLRNTYDAFFSGGIIAIVLLYFIEPLRNYIEITIGICIILIAIFLFSKFIEENIEIDTVNNSAKFKTYRNSVFIKKISSISFKKFGEKIVILGDDGKQKIEMDYIKNFEKTKEYLFDRGLL